MDTPNVDGSRDYLFPRSCRVARTSRAHTTPAMGGSGSGKKKPKAPPAPALNEGVGQREEAHAAERLRPGHRRGRVRAGAHRGRAPRKGCHPVPRQVGGVRDEAEHVGAARAPRDTDLDLLVWWKLKETKWPTLAKLVKQHLAAPASSAGVERVFSSGRQDA